MRYMFYIYRTTSKTKARDGCGGRKKRGHVAIHVFGVGRVGSSGIRVIVLEKYKFSQNFYLILRGFHLDI